MAYEFPEIDLIELNSFIEEFNAYTDHIHDAGVMPNSPDIKTDQKHLYKAQQALAIADELSTLNTNLPFMQTHENFKIILSSVKQWDRTMKSIILDEDENSPFNKIIRLSQHMVSGLVTSLSFQLANKKYDFFNDIAEDNQIMTAAESLQEIKSAIANTIEALKKNQPIPNTNPQKKTSFTLSGLFFPKKKSHKIRDSSRINADNPASTDVSGVISKLSQLEAELAPQGSNPEVIKESINAVSTLLKKYTNEFPNNSKAAISDKVTQLQMKVADSTIRLNDPEHSSPVLKEIIIAEVKKAYFDFQQTNIGQVLEIAIQTNTIPLRKNLTRKEIDTIRNTVMVAKTELDKLICLSPQSDLKKFLDNVKEKISAQAAQCMKPAEHMAQRPGLK